MKKTIPLLIALLGFTAMASQIVFMRELLVAFHGNELSIGFILASWLIGGAIGSALLGSTADRIKSKLTVFALYQLGVGLLLPLNIVMIRSIKGLFNITAGKVLPISIMASASFMVLVPVCVMLGFLFALACRIYGGDGREGSERIGSVYILEAAGALAGGLAASFFMIRSLDSVGIMALLMSLNTAGSLILFLNSEKRFERMAFSGIAAVLFFASVTAHFTGGWNALNDFSLKREWRGYGLITSENSVYGNVALAEREGEISFFDNGLLIYTVPDRPTAEESVHFALLEHPDPKKVLLIGGGAGGLLTEILKHPVEKVDYVELDPLIIKLAEKYLPDEYKRAFRDKRVSIKSTDGRAFIKAAREKYDCIIVNVGDPYTAQINRYYTEEFFKEARNALAPGGIISFPLRSSENYISNALGDFLRSVYVTLRPVFKSVAVIPGDTAYFLASDDDKALTYDYRIIVSRAAERKLNLRYVQEYYLFSKLSKERIAYIEKILKSGPVSDANRDFRPSAYYRNTIFLSTRFKDSFFSRILKSADEKAVWYAAALLLMAIIITGSAGLRSKSILNKTSLIALGAGGFTNMAYQVIMLLSFQFIYGYLFYKIGIVLTMFMAGLAAGGYYAVRRMKYLNDAAAALARIEIAMCLCLATSPLVLWFFSASRGAAASWLGSNVIFLILPVISGFAGGMQFPVAAKIYLGSKNEVGRSGGISYGVDLLGSSAGALLTGLFLIPILGIRETCLFLAALNIAVILLIFVSRICKK